MSWFWFAVGIVVGVVISALFVIIRLSDTFYGDE